MFEWHGEDLSSKKDGGIIRRILVAGEGYLTPNDGAIVHGKSQEVIVVFKCLVHPEYKFLFCCYTQLLVIIMKEFSFQVTKNLSSKSPSSDFLCIQL